MINFLGPGQAIDCLKIERGDVYMQLSNSDVKIGTISTENYSWGQNIPIEGIVCSSITLVVLEVTQQGVVFGRKHLEDKDIAVSVFFESLTENQKYVVFDLLIGHDLNKQ
jgi:hypothetical protein